MHWISFFIVWLYWTIGRDGFDDLTSVDLEKLLVDKSLSENEIIDLTLEAYHEREHSDNDEEDLSVLNATLIKEGLDLAGNLGNHFEQQNPDKERAAKFQRDLKLLIAPYRELYNGLSRNQTQPLITDFVLRTAELSTMGNRNDNREIISQNDEQNNSSDSSHTQTYAFVVRKWRWIKWCYVYISFTFLY